MEASGAICDAQRACVPPPHPNAQTADGMEDRVGARGAGGDEAAALDRVPRHAPLSRLHSAALERVAPPRASSHVRSRACMHPNLSVNSPLTRSYPPSLSSLACRAATTKRASKTQDSLLPCRYEEERGPGRKQDGRGGKRGKRRRETGRQGEGREEEGNERKERKERKERWRARGRERKIFNVEKQSPLASV